MHEGKADEDVDIDEDDESDDVGETSASSSMPEPAGHESPERPEWENDVLKIGVVDIEMAPTSRAKCFVCSASVQRGCARVLYRLRISSTMRDLRRAHVDCAEGFAREHLEVNRRAAEILAGRADGPDILRVGSDNLLASLRSLSGNGARSSGGAAAATID